MKTLTKIVGVCILLMALTMFLAAPKAIAAIEEEIEASIEAGLAWLAGQQQLDDPHYLPQSKLKPGASRAANTKCAPTEQTANEFTGFDIASDSRHEHISIVQAQPIDLDSSEVEESVVHWQIPTPVLIEGNPLEFIAQYAASYVRKDIDAFLSLFSPKCVQNGRFGFEEIGNIYSNLFDQSQEIRYNLYDIRIKTYDEGALVFGLYYFYVVEVTARYKMHQILTKGAKRRVREGDISWVLVRENGTLRILSLDDSHFGDRRVSWSDDSPTRSANGRGASDGGGNRVGKGGSSAPGDGKGGDGDSDGGGDGNAGGSGPGDGSNGDGSGSDSGGSNPGRGKAKGHDPGHSKGKGKAK